MHKHLFICVCHLSSSVLLVFRLIDFVCVCVRARVCLCVVIDVSLRRSPGFRDFIAKCLVKDPGSRPTAADLLEVAILCFRLFFL